MRSLIVAAIALVSVAYGRTDKALGIEFPDQAATWKYSDFKEYQPAVLGWSHSYKPDGGGAGAITIYVYNKGRTDIGTGITLAVSEEMASTFSVVRSAWTAQDAVVEELKTPTPLKTAEGEPIALYSVHRITFNGRKNISISGLTGFRGYFLKIRYTFPGDDVAVAQKQLGAFLQVIVGANREAATPLLSPEKKPAGKN